jgi:hypothetical protein
MPVTRLAAVVLLLGGVAFGEDALPQYVGEAGHSPNWGAKLGCSFLGEVTAVAAVGLTTYAIGRATAVDWWDASTLAYYSVGLLALVPIVPAGAMLGATYVGDRHAEDGKAWASYVGGLVGTVGGLSLFLVTYNNVMGWRGWRVPGIALYGVAAVMPAVGATVGYNLSCPRSVGYGMRDQRFLPPSVTLTRTTLPDGTRETGVSLRLLTVRL